MREGKNNQTQKAELNQFHMQMHLIKILKIVETWKMHYTTGHQKPSTQFNQNAINGKTSSAIAIHSPKFKPQNSIKITREKKNLGFEQN